MSVEDTLAVAGRLLGGKRVLKSELKSPQDVISIVRRGLPYASMVSLSEQLETPVIEVSRILGLVVRTLNRRKKSAKPLTEGESERLMRLARVVARATEVLGDKATALRWMRAKNRALDGSPPISMMDVDVGAQLVEQLLGRIEYGVYG